MDGGPSGDGFGLRGSVGFARQLVRVRRLRGSSVDVIDLEYIAVGLGGHYPLNDNFDLVGRVGYTEVD